MKCSLCKQEGHRKDKCTNRTIRQKMEADLYLKYLPDFDYEVDTSGCDCYPDYCRCGTIVDIKLTEVARISIDQIKTKILYNLEGDKDWLAYAFSRGLEFFGFYEPDNWEPNIIGGYYGEELDGGLLDARVLDSFCSWFENFYRSDFSVQVKMLLEREYGYLLPELQEATFSIVELPVTSVFNPNEYRKLDRDRIEFYKQNKPDIAGILLQDGERYRLIDGYHRNACLLGSKKLHKYVVGVKMSL